MKKSIHTNIEVSTKGRLLEYGKGVLNEGIETVVKVADSKEVIVRIETILVLLLLFVIPVHASEPTIPSNSSSDCKAYTFGLQNRSVNLSHNFNIYINIYQDSNPRTGHGQP